MINKTFGQLVAMTSGSSPVTLPPSVASGIIIQGVSTDTRKLVPGNLFVPLVGRNEDAHIRVEEAFRKGAAAALWQRDRENPPADAPLIFVDNTLEALQQLAASYLAQLSARVIGITGSNGKTTTKDMVGSVLSTVYKVHKSQGNYNTHEGLPLTVLQAEEDVDWLVLEMGMRGRGEIELLTRIARPDVAIITSIGEAHMERLGSKLEIARAKTEILLGLKDGGLFIRPGDEPLLNETTREIELPRGMTTVRFGLGLTGNNDLIAEQVELVTGGTAFRIKDEEGEYFVPLLGRHNVTNALAAIAAGRYAGVEQPDIVRGLKELVMTGMRIEVVRSSSGATMLNDAFNASPSSMRAGLELLSELTGYSGKIAVLGDMLELGPEEAELHRQIGAMLDPNVIGHVFVYGRLAKYIAEEAVKRYPQGRVLAFEDKQELIRVLSETLGPQDVVLVKGSRGMQLEQVIEGLLALEGL